MSGAGEDEDGWQRYELAVDGESLPPDGDLREPAVDPWPTCPIVPLGMQNGICHLLDYRREYRALSSRQLASQAELMTLLGGETEWLWLCFPRRTTRKIKGELRSVTIGFHVQAACRWIIKACAQQAMFGPHIVIRKPGVWPGEHGDPVAHCGDVLFIDGVDQPAGLRTGDMIWPADPPVARPGQACDAQIGRHIQAMMQEYWYFRSPGGAILCIGVTASAMLGAWPRWRPSLFIGGDVGGGKSYLLDTLRAM